ncbi:hypothetical protein A9K69_19225 [Stenotrophomonas maltophilia]|nr:hypothetical protein A9K69_19225 [Stenotrophomonas maltophilia]
MDPNHRRPPGFKSAWEEICHFIKRYAAACEFRFVLSFQFGSVFAARLGKDLVFPGPATP